MKRTTDEETITPDVTEQSVTAEKSLDEILAEYNSTMEVVPDAEQAGEPDASGEPAPEPSADAPKKRGRKPGGKNRPKDEPLESDFITGAVFLMFVDFIIPELIAIINNKFSKKEKVDANLLRLTSEQRKQVEPIADNAMNAIKWKMHPGIILGVTMVGCYAMNLAVARELSLSKSETA